MGYFYVKFTMPATTPGKTYELGYGAVQANSRQEAVDKVGKGLSYLAVEVTPDDVFASECMAMYGNRNTYYTGD